MFSEGVDEEVLIAREKSSEEIFSELVNHFEEMTNLSDLEKKFALQPGIDTETFTYLCMEPEKERNFTIKIREQMKPINISNLNEPFYFLDFESDKDGNIYLMGTLTPKQLYM